MLPVQKPKHEPLHTLNAIRERKEQLLEEINADNAAFTKKWHQLFVPKESSTKAEFVSAMISNGITAIDAFLVVRKLYKNYGGLFGLKKKKRKG